MRFRLVSWGLQTLGFSQIRCTEPFCNIFKEVAIYFSCLAKRCSAVSEIFYGSTSFTRLHVGTGPAENDCDYSFFGELLFTLVTHFFFLLKFNDWEMMKDEFLAAGISHKDHFLWAPVHLNKNVFHTSVFFSYRIACSLLAHRSHGMTNKT